MQDAIATGNNVTVIVNPATAATVPVPSTAFRGSSQPVKPKTVSPETRVDAGIKVNLRVSDRTTETRTPNVRSLEHTLTVSGDIRGDAGIKGADSLAPVSEFIRKFANAGSPRPAPSIPSATITRDCFGCHTSLKAFHLSLN